MEILNSVIRDLERKLKIRGDALLDMGRNLHVIYAHPGSYNLCPNSNCEMVRKILNMTEPENKNG